MKLVISVTCVKCSRAMNHKIKFDIYSQGPETLIARQVLRCSLCGSLVSVNVQEDRPVGHNLIINKTNTSGITGVSYHRWSKTWRAHIFCSGKQHFVGNSPDFEEAVAMRYAAEQQVGTYYTTPALLFMEGRTR